jgi:phage terminase large subunit GpA-like protein
MSNSEAVLLKAVRHGVTAWRPPRFISLSEWADKHAYLSSESSAVTGKFHCLSYQRAILDAFSDRRTETITLMKSARVGGTKAIDFAIAYRIDQNPRPMLVVQPTIFDAKRFSKAEIKPMFRDTPVLWGKVSKARSRDSGDTMQQKDFIGGTLYLVGANSPSGLSSITVGDIFLDEVDRYNSEAGDEGDPISLAIRRGATFPNRKVMIVSSPFARGKSKIEYYFLAGDQRRYYVPCRKCGCMATLQFRAIPGREPGFIMEWPEGRPEAAFFRCPECKGEIADEHKTWMMEHGEWRAKMPFNGHASFHIWAAYSYSVNESWGNIAKEFLKAKETPETLKVFINTWLGETWVIQGEAPDWHRLYERREDYPKGMVPNGARVITAAADVQDDRIEVEIVAWGAGLESWGIDYRVLLGDTDSISNPVWRMLDELLIEQFEAANGHLYNIARFAIDCGYRTQIVTAWAARHGFPRVVAVKGIDNERQVIGAPAYTEYTLGGKRRRGSVRHYPIGVSLIKGELYGWLRQAGPTKENPAIPIGWCHFSTNIHNEEYFRQLTAECLTVKENKAGRKKYEWVKDHRRNEALDVRVYNRALAFQLGVDRWKREAGPTLPKAREAAMVKPELPEERVEQRPLLTPRSRRAPLQSSRFRRLW